MKVIVKTFFWPLIFVSLVQLASSSLQFVLPVLIHHILAYIESEDETIPRSRGVILALGMFVVNIMVSFLSGQFNKQITELGLEVRSALISMIYRKALVLSPKSRNNKGSAGEITNHMSTDAEKWTKDLFWVICWVTVPFEILVASVMLYNVLGWSVLCGLFTIVVITPIQGKAGRFFDSAGDARLEAMDSRVRIMSELLSHIKNIKLYGYEPHFKDKATSYREQEINLLRQTGKVMSLLTIIFTCLPLFMAFVSFAVYASVGGPGFTQGDMNAQVIFVSVSLFSLLYRPIGIMSRLAESTIGLRVATRRVQKFLLKEEQDPLAIERDPNVPKDPNVPLIQIENGTFAWAPEHENPAEEDNDAGGGDNDDESSQEQITETTALLTAEQNSSNGPALVGINASFARGSLTAVVGRVGQGKSSLLSAMIGDMYKREGHVRIYGSVAYVPQQAWIINATVRDNIVFGKPFDQERYGRVLFASGLLPDLQVLAAGDQTEIGERGINLSGGQKQRVSLARAAYLNADIYLLDDPLSAVDAHVDQHLWEHLLGPTGLLKDKTRVLVTHGIHHLEQVDHILLIRDGRIKEAGGYTHLMKANDVFYNLIKEFSIGRKKKVKHASTSSNTTGDEDESSTIADEVDSVKGGGEHEAADGGLVDEENTQVGIVGWSTFKAYCEAMSYYYFTITVLLYLVWEIFQQSVPFWLEYWTRVANTTTHTVIYFLSVYAALVIAYIAVDVYLTYVSNVHACLRASIVLHENLLARVLRLPMCFFDVTPQGRVLNRFSSDISCIDETVPDSFLSLLTCFFNLLGTLFILTFATPAFIATLPVMALIILVIQRYYIKTSSMLRRLESISKSPLYQHFDETLNGVSSIRAMGIQSRFIDENAARSDRFANAYYSSMMINRWLNVRLEALSTLSVLIVALLAVGNKDSLSPSIAGLALSNSLSLTYNVIWTLRSYCDLAGDLVAVERVHEYSNKRTEAPNSIAIELPHNWPSQGRVSFKNYSARYRQGLDLVIKNVSFEVNPGQRIGIVGRTGAGKSSLTLALFRIIEAADSYWARASAQDGHFNDGTNVEPLIDGGHIEIDEVDISTLGLKDLRQRLSIIPQDPTLFSGTIRENLDPFDQATDAEIWEALDRAHLKDYISSLTNGLSFEVAQNGENLSVGQRSLLCLARALLRKSKVLVLDEATAAVDVETDELIQKTIRKEFQDRTILTIAHRIKTIMDYDKILVLEKGQVEEYDTPANLLRKKGLFYSLAEQAGETH
ncbi:P-loop containing nucleoside triphosphate hydrolase protein [Lobosporangium transversale]|uniref:p-loop containing nucleoside triphosphate hydrolase protein n=1 Tax=Lobosporangium transversale TaxID=64571 RepID=A0A1Y2GM29_9FUNG|nr:P-loop containing nucleoside triphosphate hydrolase protein [Lobosporangium transversale]ORZ14972.1 P-loop containing nucleoside triphosphate hydrolase protein [Lobosporangium transversale]|eukprot:XP_021881104.1 P-loop containing nucleoside triphosphate hydrolase protein [Lobosporangium transversale]